MDFLKNYIGCCDTSASMSAELEILQVNPKMEHNNVSLTIEIRFSTNCTTIKKGDVMYIQERSRSKNIRRMIEPSQISYSNMMWIKTQNDFGYSDVQNFKTNIDQGVYTIFYIRPVKIFDVDNTRWRVLGQSKFFKVDFDQEMRSLDQSVRQDNRNIEQIHQLQKNNLLFQLQNQFDQNKEQDKNQYYQMYEQFNKNMINSGHIKHDKRLNIVTETKQQQDLLQMLNQQTNYQDKCRSNQYQFSNVNSERNNAGISAFNQGISGFQTNKYDDQQHDFQVHNNHQHQQPEYVNDSFMNQSIISNNPIQMNHVRQSVQQTQINQNQVNQNNVNQNQNQQMLSSGIFNQSNRAGMETVSNINSQKQIYNSVLENMMKQNQQQSLFQSPKQNMMQESVNDYVQSNKNNVDNRRKLILVQNRINQGTTNLNNDYTNSNRNITYQ